MLLKLDFRFLSSRLLSNILMLLINHVDNRKPVVLQLSINLKKTRKQNNRLDPLTISVEYRGFRFILRCMLGKRACCVYLQIRVQ